MTTRTWLLFALLGCALAGCPRRHIATTEDAGPPTLGPSAKPANEDDVTRYPYETKIANEPATIARDYVVVHKSPPDGPKIAEIGSGTAVVKIAQTNKDVLITFDDATSEQRMMGWVGEEAFTPPSATPAAGGGHWTPPARKDAGGGAAPVAAVDAGGGGSTPAAVDAGGAHALGPIVAPAAGTCPANYQLDEGMCHMKCTRGPECGNKRCTHGLCK